MKHLKTYNIFENKSDWIIAYHSSYDFEHMVNSDFKLSVGTTPSLFGDAIYFSQSPNVRMFGKFQCKFKIKLEETSIRYE